MRVLFPVLATSLFAMGCAEEPVVLNQHTGTLNARTNGVTLFEDSFVGFVGMEGTTCGVDTLSGETLDDVDLPGYD